MILHEARKRPDSWKVLRLVLGMVGPFPSGHLNGYGSGSLLDSVTGGFWKFLNTWAGSPYWWGSSFTSASPETASSSGTTRPGR